MSLKWVCKEALFWTKKLLILYSDIKNHNFIFYKQVQKVITLMWCRRSCHRNATLRMKGHGFNSPSSLTTY